MERMRRILVATDFSDQAERAAWRARALAPADGSLHLLHVLAEGPLQRLREVLGVSVGREAREAVLAAARERLEDLRARLAAEYAGTVSAEVVEGHPRTAIGDYARAGGYDLVVAGAYGQEGEERLFSGVTAQKVVRTADRPVLLVRAGEGAGRGYRRVVVAVDFSAASRKALEWALALCPEATLYVLHVFELPFQQSIDYDALPLEVAERYREEGHALAKAELDRFLDGFGDCERCRPLVRQGDPSRVILGQAQAQEADLVVVGSRGLGGMSETLLGSVNLHLLHRAECDVLTVRP